MKWIKNRLKFGSRQYKLEVWKLIKLWSSLINKKKLNWRIDKFEDLIEITLINEIMGLIEEIPNFRVDSS